MSSEESVIANGILTEELLARYIIDATNEVFAATAMMEPIDDYPLSTKLHQFLCNVTGVIGFAGTHSGAISVHCPNALAFKVAANMYGAQCGETNEGLERAIGKITHLVAEHVRLAVSKEGFEVRLSVPSVIAGEAYTINTLSKNNRSFIPFFVDDDKFLVGVTIAD